VSLKTLYNRLEEYAERDLSSTPEALAAGNDDMCDANSRLETQV